jgi:hypothetical protein
VREAGGGGVQHGGLHGDLLRMGPAGADAEDQEVRDRFDALLEVMIKAKSSSSPSGARARTCLASSWT